jgi:hypothetical protein
MGYDALGDGAEVHGVNHALIEGRRLQAARWEIDIVHLRVVEALTVGA